MINQITKISIEDELKNSYLDYAMSVIAGRALPDVRDGLKPVHRRTLFAMHVLNNDSNKSYKKSARIVGDVIGKYHPHGDTAVYDTIVRMAQPFSLRYILIDGQGNFGSVDGDSAAAMRYTEIRMAKLTHLLLTDLDKETVDFVPNYDGTEFIPSVLPTRIPNLLVNGTSGIAVGMATNVPPHNLTEVINAALALIDNREISIDELIENIPGPDFPTAGIINGVEGIIQAYKTGRGKISIRAKTAIEVNEKNQRETIIVTELPYQVNKARLVEKIAQLTRDKKITGITALRDESDKDGMRIVIEVKHGESGEVILNNLYSHTQMQNVFGINLVALDRGQPKLMNLKDMLEAFVHHRQEVVTRRTRFELNKARAKAHILEGLAVALVDIDSIIELIKKAASPLEAKQQLLQKNLCCKPIIHLLKQENNEIAITNEITQEYGIQGEHYRLSAAQVQAILDLRLHRLTALEYDKIIDEYEMLRNVIKELLCILASKEQLMAIISKELIEAKEQFGDPRRTIISTDITDMQVADLIVKEDVVVTLSYEGYVKYQPLSVYEAQRRGGKGKVATKMKEEDFIEQLLIANTHDTILCFSSLGRLYWLKTYQLPLASRIARGKPIVNILPLAADERITAILPITSYDENKYILMVTANGTVKKTLLTAYSNQRKGGIIAVNLRGDDELVGVALTEAGDQIMLFSDAGKVVRFNEEQVRAVGRTSTGVRGIKLDKGQRVVSLIIPKNDGEILTVTRNGYGKRTQLSEYPAKNRATKGVVSIKISERNGPVVGAVLVFKQDEFMLISDQGTLVRSRVTEISTIGRNTQGVTLIRTAENEHVVGLQRINEPTLVNISDLNGMQLKIDS